MAITESLTLHPLDLANDYGFGDGDIADAYVSDWTDGSWAARFDLDGVDEAPVITYLAPRALLGAAISTYLAPTLSLPDGAVLARFTNTHNPFRVCLAADLPRAQRPFSVPSRPWEPTPEQQEELDRQLAKALGQAAPVVVTPDQLTDLCDRLYPERPTGWLDLYQAAWWGYSFKRELPSPEDPLLQEDVHRLRPLLDEYAAYLPDEALGLAAELLAARRAGAAWELDAARTAADLDAVLRAAHAVTADAGSFTPAMADVLAALRAHPIVPDLPRVRSARTSRARTARRPSAAPAAGSSARDQ